MAETAERGADIALVAAGASVLFSWYEFYVRGDKASGLFVGLWPPTILAFASYIQQKSEAKRRRGGMAERVQRMIGEK